MCVEKIHRRMSSAWSRRFDLAMWMIQSKIQPGGANNRLFAIGDNDGNSKSTDSNAPA